MFYCLLYFYHLKMNKGWPEKGEYLCGLFFYEITFLSCSRVAQQEAQRAQFYVEKAKQDQRQKIIQAEGEAEAAKLVFCCRFLYSTLTQTHTHTHTLTIFETFCFIQAYKGFPWLPSNVPDALFASTSTSFHMIIIPCYYVLDL